MVLTLAGSTLQIALRIILTWFFFPHFELAAPAIATGIGLPLPAGKDWAAAVSAPDDAETETGSYEI